MPQKTYESKVSAGLAVDIVGLDLQVIVTLALGHPHGSHFASYAFEDLQAHR